MSTLAAKLHRRRWILQIRLARKRSAAALL